MNSSPSNKSFKPSFSRSVFSSVRLLALAIACGLSSQMAKAAAIEFTTDEGYANGNLTGQPGASPTWLASNGGAGSFVVNTSGGGSVQLATNGNGAVIGYQPSLDFTTGATFTSSFDFSFVQSLAMGAVTGGTTMISNAYLQNQNASIVAGVSASFGRNFGPDGTVVDGYRLAFGSMATNIAGIDLGIDSANGDVTSDVIRITLTLQQGSSAANWIGTETVYDVTQSKVLATKFLSNLNVGNTGAQGDTSLFNAIAQGGGMATSGISSLSVLSYTTPVPEPSTWALLALAGTVLVVVRRRVARA
jgi:PEP-CTERM motif